MIKQDLEVRLKFCGLTVEENTCYKPIWQTMEYNHKDLAPITRTKMQLKIEEKQAFIRSYMFPSIQDERSKTIMVSHNVDSLLSQKVYSTKVLNGKCPIQLLYPDASFHIPQKLFRCVFTPKQQKDNLDPNDVKCIFEGYPSSQKLCSIFQGEQGNNLLLLM